MAVIRCPMCDKPNPADAEVCWNCEARLRPLAADPTPEENPPLASKDEPDLSSQPTQNEGEWQAESSLPDWLQSLRQDEETTDTEPALEADLSSWQPEEESSLPAEEKPEEFDWLTDSREEELPDAEAEPAEPEEEAPAWLKDLSAEEKPETPETWSFPEAEAPEWFSQYEQEAEEEIPPEEGLDIPKEEPAEPGDLAPGNLPTWLESMRPVEDAAPNPPVLDEQDRRVEGSGPLSGLHGVLPFEPGTSQVKKPAAYSIKLQVTENQQAHATAFEELIKQEGESRPVPGKPVLSSLTVLRWAIFIVLLIGIGWPVWTASQVIPLPAVPPETEAASTLINRLPGGANVLVAVDYQPGLSAEMDATSGAVIDQLMSKGAYLALVSTTPSGPLQAERLIGRVSGQGEYAYTGINQFANLGFIPGGTAGLRSFAETPQRILPYALDGSLAWQITPLESIQKLENFALVLVATESPETAQAWIEQVQPLLGQTPLLMVVSSQADPVVRPYYEGRPQQVQGLVTGLAGGASFERLQGRPGQARKYWDSFSLGLLLAVVLILVGGAISSALALLSNRKMADGEKQV